MKHLNFSGNLDLKHNIVAKFLLRSHSLSQYMTIKQKINQGAIQKVCHFIHLCNTLPILLYHLSCNIKSNKLWKEKKEGFYIYGCFSVSRYVKEGRKSDS